MSLNYNYRIFDRYRKEVISAVIFTDTDAGYRPDRYLVNRWGFKHEMEFILVKLIDYRGRTDELEESSNPFALVVKAFLRYIEEKGELKKLYEAKRQLLNALFAENYSKRCIYALFRF
ncbi:MAG: transposase, partial [Spirochaetes bacterium]